MLPGAKEWLSNVFLMVFGQQLRPVAQRNKLYPALASQTILVGKIKSLLSVVCVCGFFFCLFLGICLSPGSFRKNTGSIFLTERSAMTEIH